ncbi:MAG: hypothetical protein ACTSYA_05965, partial [Candidatus Kariarchaeaceae archaeon]
MNKRIITNLVLIVLLLGILSPSPVKSLDFSTENFQGKNIIIDVTHGAYHLDYNYFIANMTSYGASVTVMNETYTFDPTAHVMMFSEPDLAFNNTEKVDLKNWLGSGSKVLWISADSDYAGLYLPTEANSLLEYLGAHLRISAESFEDQESSDDSAYRLIANETGTSALALEVTEGVNQVVFHGPTAVIGYDGALVDLRTTDIPNVDVIISTSAAAYAIDSDLSETEYDFYSGISTINGTYPMLVMEKIGNSYIIVSGETTFADYKNMYGLISEKGRPTEGSLLVDQLLNYCLLSSNDIAPPKINSPDDVYYKVNDTGNKIAWTATDRNPATYSIFFSSYLIESGDWYSGVPISISVDGLSIGTHSYTIVVSDYWGDSVTDQVNVIVSEEEPIDNTTPSDSDSSLDSVYSPLSWLICAGSLVGLVVYTKKKK